MINTTIKIPNLHLLFTFFTFWICYGIDYKLKEPDCYLPMNVDMYI